MCADPIVVGLNCLEFFPPPLRMDGFKFFLLASSFISSLIDFSYVFNLFGYTSCLYGAVCANSCSLVDLRAPALPFLVVNLALNRIDWS